MLETPTARLAARLLNDAGPCNRRGDGLRRALERPEEALRELESADVRGRGGADFPLARKWRAALQQRPPRVVVANGGEHEPGSAKDALLMERHPDLVVEGLAIAAALLQAARSYVVVAEPFRRFLPDMERAVNELAFTELGVVVPQVVVAPDGYLVGEETALLEVLEEKAPRPRFRPPVPVVRGYFGYSTVVQNVETLANCAWVLRHHASGAAGATVNTFLWTLWGLDLESTVSEAPFGVTIGRLLAGAGIEEWKAVLLGGFSGGALACSESETPLERSALAAAGAALGCAAIRPVRPEECVGRLVEEVLTFFAGESCGQCVPCASALADGVRVMAGNRTTAIADVDDLVAVLTELTGRGVCKLPDGAARTVLGLWRRFEHEIRRHAQRLCDCEPREGA